MFVMKKRHVRPFGCDPRWLWCAAHVLSVLALLQVGGHPPKASQEVIEQVKDLDGDFEFETYFSLSCQNCPDVVQALNLI